MTLSDMLCDFKFESPSDRAVLLAAILTVTLRSLIDGTTPMFFFDGHTPGSGKTLMADLVSLIAFGHDAPRMTQQKTEEFKKEVLALLIANQRLCLIDNVTRPLGDGVLDGLITSKQWRGRVLRV